MKSDSPLYALLTKDAETFNCVLSSVTQLTGELNLVLIPQHYEQSWALQNFNDLRRASWIQSSAELPKNEVLKTTHSKPTEGSGVRLGILTSGTAGIPKLIWHRLDRLRAPAEHARKLGPRVWLQAYEPCSYAGLQVWFAVQASGGRLITAPNEPSQLPTTLVQQGVEVISATPSWWRRLLYVWPENLPFPQLVQASMGGERVDQDLLDAVDKSFRPLGMSHLYASTEAGMIFVVSDRKAGFPLGWLNDSNRRPAIRLNEDGVLEVFIEDVGWLNTGDLTTVRGDRVYFAGRTDNIINLGGLKISAELLETELMQTGLFTDVFVYARKNPVTGQILAADVVARRELGEIPIAELKATLRTSLAGHRVPQMIRWVNKIEITAHGKKIRK